MSNIVDLYPHNKKVYIEVMKNLKSHNKVGVVQATGTGKGKLAACFVERVIKNSSTAKVLVVAPNLSILQNYRDNFGIQDKRIIFSTYSNLINKSELDLEKVGETFSLIILDEFHRAGAEKWMIAINSIFKGVDKGNCKVIGLTATPKRFLDKSRDMGDELFDGNIIKGLDLAEAIIDGILPGFIYNACYFGAENKLKELEKKLESEDSNIINDTVRNDLLVKVKELALIYKNRLKVENIIKEGTKELGENQKWLIFCRDINSLNQIREFCKSWFNYKPNIFIVNSKKAPEDNDRILKEFREVKEDVNVLLCVNMLNEGVHIKDLNGVIMMRQTESPILFLQQLGRALETGKDFKPIIFDLIGNYRGLTAQFEDIEGNPVSIVRGIETKTKGHKNYVIVHSFMEEMDYVLDEIDAVCSIFWTKEEEAILIKYGTGKTISETVKYILENKLLNRTEQAIRKKLQLLNCCIPVCKSWTKEEDLILVKYGKDKTISETIKYILENKLLDRTEIAIQQRLLTLKCCVYENKPWTKEEDAILIKCGKSMGKFEVVRYILENKLLDRREQSILNRLSELKCFIYENKPWTKEEDDILRKNSKGKSVPETVEYIIKNNLINRTESGIAYRLRELKCCISIKNSKFWTKEEDEILRKYGTGKSKSETIKYILENKLLNRTESAIRRRLEILNCCIQDETFWTKEEDVILKKYGKGKTKSETVKYILKNKLLNRTESAIRGRLDNLNCCIQDERFWTKEEDDILRKYGKGKTVPETLKYIKENNLINRPISSIKDRLYILKCCIGNNEWTKKEDEILIKYGKGKTISETIRYILENKLLNRTKSAIRGRLEKLNCCVSILKSWTKDEDAVLITYGKGKTISEIVKYVSENKLLDRTERAIEARVIYLRQQGLI